MSVVLNVQHDFADVEDEGTVSAHDSRGGMAGFQILGTWAGTITFEAKLHEAGTWVSIIATNVATSAQATTTTANGVFRIVSDGLDVRARFSTDTSGTVNVWPFTREV